MNGLEVDFLFRINFSLHVTPELFFKYREELVSHSNGTPAGVVTPQPSSPLPVVPQQEHHFQVPQHVMVQPSVQETNPPFVTTAPKRTGEVNYITPSPPNSSAKSAMIPNGAEMVPMSEPHGPAMPPQPVLHRANTMPPVPAPGFSTATHYGRCSQPIPTDPMQVNGGGQQYVVYNNGGTAYQYGATATLVHFNHAPKQQQQDGFMVTEATTSSSGQYFVGNGQMLGCSSRT